MRIGIFDSGNGGLSVLHEAYHILPNQEYVYYADTKHVPYGIKTKEEIRDFCDEIVSFLIDKKVDAIVIACNTATAVAAGFLREKYDLPILAMEPAVKPAVERLTGDEKRVLVMATPVTIREEKLENLLKRVDQKHKVDLLEMPGLVTFAENEEYDSDNVKAYLKKRFAGIDGNDYSSIVMGCTHFNYFKPLYKEVLGENITCIDGNNGTIRHLADVLNLDTNSSSNMALELNEPQDIVVRYKTTYYDSGDEITDNKRLSKILRMLTRLEYVRSF
ncbi:MAG: glutamate racemase [Butyrivibrio sp.]|nr:glutamate racemase [Butyrivibrio sp.]